MTTARRLLRRLRVALVPGGGQALALAALAALLAAALVSAPLFLAAAEEGAWLGERGRTDEADLGAVLDTTTVPTSGAPSPARIGRAGELDEGVTAAVAAAGLPDPRLQVRLREPLLAEGPGGLTGLELLARTGWEEQVDFVAGGPGDGVAVPRRLAEATGLAPGGVLEATSAQGLPVSLPVTGVYAEPVAPLPAYWAEQASLFVPRIRKVTGLPIPRPPVLLAPREVVLGTATELQVDLFLQWRVAVPDGIGTDGARDVLARVDGLRDALADPASPVGRLTAQEDVARPTPRSGLGDALVAVDDTVALLRSPVRAVGAGAGLTALVLVGAWAGHRVRRREDELRLLLARGGSPVRAAGQAVREALLPVLAGTAAGAAAGWLLVRQFGPAPRFPAGTLPPAAAVLAAGALAGLAVLALTTALLVARLDRGGRPAPARLPWLAVTAAVTAVVAVPAVAGADTGAAGDDGGGGLGVLPLLLPLPVAAVVAGLLTAGLSRVGRGAGRRLPAPAFLAVRRVAAASGTSRLVVVTTAVSLGLVVHATTLAGSAERTMDAKAAVAAGAETVVPLLRRTDEPGPVPAGTALVSTEAGVTLSPGDLDADLLALDPAEVAGVLRWDDGLADRPVRDVLDALAGYRGDRVPVLLAGPLPDDALGAPGTDLVLTRVRSYTLPLEVVGRVAAFPGQPSRTPLVVADRGAVEAVLAASGRDPVQLLDRQVWAGTPPGVLLPELEAGGHAFDRETVTTAGAFPARPAARAQLWSLEYLRAVGLAAGALGLLGVVLHALAQQRRRRVAAVMLARAGLRRRSADLAVALETGLLAGLGAAVAVAVALPASALVVRLLDPDPGVLPGPVLAVPAGTLAVVAAGVAAVAGVSAVLAARARRTADAGLVVRGAP
ncbi:hypothetical protein [Geodermatophilus nigrescens]|uniref:Putative ABC transport system permease protein n=1 Tax=Geodermatophilus nigrescens TaxID=1070870 RepID=A0A1M5QC24_9ACTN|nr:hypothetical protein [Geodermatophilus nigrescens]SHH11734.1 putative ABC transport system permease protein [Geodermatophilus nigrescens]